MNTDVLANEISRAETQFTIEVVDTRRQLREVFQLRHQVYCVERGYEAGRAGEETDEFDPRSSHVLLRHTRDREVVGTVRLVAPDQANLNGSFPMQRLCEPTLLGHLPLATTGEISRFAISKERRSSCAEGMLTRLALMRGIVQLSSEMGLTHWLAVMERGLMRLQQRNAIHFDPVGSLVSYHGIRQPTVGAVVPVLERVRAEEFPTWDFLTNGGKWFAQPQRPPEPLSRPLTSFDWNSLPGTARQVDRLYSQVA